MFYVIFYTPQIKIYGHFLFGQITKNNRYFVSTVDPSNAGQLDRRIYELSVIYTVCEKLAVSSASFVSPWNDATKTQAACVQTPAGRYGPQMTSSIHAQSNRIRRPRRQTAMCNIIHFVRIYIYAFNWSF